MYRELYMTIGKLPPRAQEVILLYVDGKSNEEIARHLGLSIETIKSHKKNAIRFLKNHLGHLNLLIIILYMKRTEPH